MSYTAPGFSLLCVTIAPLFILRKDFRVKGEEQQERGEERFSSTRCPSKLFLGTAQLLVCVSSCDHLATLLEVRA